MRKVKLQFSQTPTKYNYKITRLERVKVLDETGKFIKFAPHNDSVLEYLQDMEIEIPDNIDIQSK